MDLDTLTERFNNVGPTLQRYFEAANLLSLKFWVMPLATIIMILLVVGTLDALGINQARKRHLGKEDDFGDYIDDLD